MSKLTNKIIDFAWKLNNFLIAINKLLSKKSKKFFSILQNILSNIFKSMTSYTTIKNIDHTRFIELIIYLFDWIVDKPTFKKIIKNFVTNTKVYRYISIYIDFLFSFETRSNNLSKRQSFLSLNLSILRIAIRFQDVDNTSILKRNRCSLDFSIFILSIFFILSLQEIFFDFQNELIFFIT